MSSFSQLDLVFNVFSSCSYHNLYRTVRTVHNGISLSPQNNLSIICFFFLFNLISEHNLYILIMISDPRLFHNLKLFLFDQFTVQCTHFRLLDLLFGLYCRTFSRLKIGIIPSKSWRHLNFITIISFCESRIFFRFALRCIIVKDFHEVVVD